MKCLNPYINAKGEAYGCGQCLPCSVRRRRIWTHRILLEASQWRSNAFVTLSYRNSQLPIDGSSHLPTLNPREVQLFLKRLRKRLDVSPRFFVTGEYGDKTWRPHYHMALFNFIPCLRGGTLRRYPSGQLDWAACCPQCKMLGEAWGLGDIQCGELESNRAGYVAGYVTKKLTRKGDIRLEGRHPEFARMSLRPGIGAGVVERIAEVLVSHGLDESELDVPTVLRHGKKQMPLGRYLRRRLRIVLGKDERCPDEILQALQEEMSELRQEVEKATSNPTLAKFRKTILKNAIIDANMGLKWKIEADEARKPKRTI